MVDLVAQNDKGGIGELFHGEEGVELGFGFDEALVVLCVDEENYAGDFGDYMGRSARNVMFARAENCTVVAPKSAGLCVASEIEGCEFDIAYRELFGRWVQGWLAGLVGQLEVLACDFCILTELRPYHS